jgi:CheY-like chemotaxis protein
MRKCQSVLYVDDDPDICEVVQSSLHLLSGFDVRTAESGERAMELALELQPDLILMDVMMPGLDGPSTLKRMRASAALADIPVIFLTAKVLPAEVAHFLNLGAIGVIRKPFDPLRLGSELFTLWKRAYAPERETPKRTSSSSEDEVRAQVLSLTESFLKRTSADIEMLRGMIERVRSGDRAALKEILIVAHSINGAGAMFGFPEVSASGRAIERSAEGAIGSPGGCGGPAALQELSDYTEALQRRVVTAGRARGTHQGLCTGSGR